MEIYFLIKDGDDIKPNSILNTDSRLENYYRTRVVNWSKLDAARVKSLREFLVEFMEKCEVDYALANRGLPHESEALIHEDIWVGYIFNVYCDYSYSDKAGEILLLLNELERAALELVFI